MKTIKIGLILIAVLFSTLAFTQNQVKYEYLSMTMKGNSIHLNRDFNTYEEINVKDEKNDKHHLEFGPLLKRVQDYEDDGWELVTNEVWADGASYIANNYVLMRRKK
jgi:hypothetical protein